MLHDHYTQHNLLISKTVRPFILSDNRHFFLCFIGSFLDLIFFFECSIACINDMMSMDISNSNINSKTLTVFVMFLIRSYDHADIAATNLQLR